MAGAGCSVDEVRAAVVTAEASAVARGLLMLAQTFACRAPLAVLARRATTRDQDVEAVLADMAALLDQRLALLASGTGRSC